MNRFEAAGLGKDVAEQLQTICDHAWYVPTDILEDSMLAVLRQYEAIPAACKRCSNHPSNGVTGICFCTLGLPEIR